ncbi:phytanoyl-CoA dioxygenase family protein [Microvirga splendida]|uniref:Phytanoyl-CoA dioxygenase family protein n=1 Tax=Microvirga splendida TaxID=2795727 RepID=A0ABS0Y4A3_9HYPH|nr:phytanoyl-CoA dioxygenase family protein [Microvirga splendida]
MEPATSRNGPTLFRPSSRPSARRPLDKVWHDTRFPHPEESATRSSRRTRKPLPVFTGDAVVLRDADCVCSSGWGLRGG